MLLLTDPGGKQRKDKNEPKTQKLKHMPRAPGVLSGKYFEINGAGHLKSVVSPPQFTQTEGCQEQVKRSTRETTQTEHQEHNAKQNKVECRKALDIGHHSPALMDSASLPASPAPSNRAPGGNKHGPPCKAAIARSQWDCPSLTSPRFGLWPMLNCPLQKHKAKRILNQTSTSTINQP